MAPLMANVSVNDCVASSIDAPTNGPITKAICWLIARRAFAVVNRWIPTTAGTNDNSAALNDAANVPITNEMAASIHISSESVLARYANAANATARQRSEYIATARRPLRSMRNPPRKPKSSVGMFSMAKIVVKALALSESSRT